MIKDFGLISIITPNYNCERFIAQTIESVQAQTYKNWELLIQDDGSNDGSLKIALDYATKDYRIKVESNLKKSGAAITRNNAIMRSRGVYLAFLDSDDLWLPMKLERQLLFMLQNDCDFTFSKYEHISEDGISLLVQAKVTKHLTYNKLLLHSWPGCLTVMYKQDINNKVYCNDVKKNNDTALFLKVIRTTKNAMGIDECLALYRIRKGSISRNKITIIKPFIKVIHKFENKRLLTAYFCVFTHMLVKIFFKYKKITHEQSVLGSLK